MGLITCALLVKDFPVFYYINRHICAAVRKIEAKHIVPYIILNPHYVPFNDLFILIILYI